jgi:peptidoglycan/LPS O-acetylase OafA/YrhL
MKTSDATERLRGDKSASTGQPGPGGPAVKYLEIERLRGVAILMTLLVHFYGVHAYISSRLRATWAGVDLFFVISGFVVTLSLLRTLPSVEKGGALEAFDRSGRALRVFYVRRFFRLFPMTLCAGLFQLALAYAFPHSSAIGSVAQWKRDFLFVLTTTINYCHSELHSSMWIFWSLAVEEHFYLLLPLLLVLCRTRGRRLACAVLFVALIAFAVRPLCLFLGATDVQMPTHLRLDSLMAGTVLALLFEPGTSSRAFMPSVVMRWLVVPFCLLVLVALPSYFGGLLDLLKYWWGPMVLWLFAAILVRLAARDEGLVLPIPILSRALEFLGARAYGIYILHIQFFYLQGELLGKHPTWIARLPDGAMRVVVPSVLAAAASVVAAHLAYRLIEQPCTRYGRSITAADPGSAREAAKWVRPLAWGAPIAAAAAVYWYFMD